MSTSGSSISALISAFTFGIVVNAAAAALFLHASSHGSSIFRDGQRLVLAIFFLSAALWAQADFISIAINTTAAGSCQVGVIFSTLFDQLGRYSIEQYLLWTINSVSKPGAQNVIPQIIVAVRFVLGAVFVGLSRPHFDPVCVSVSSVFALGIGVLALDAVIVAVLAIRAFTSAPAAGVQADQSESGRTKAVLLVIASFAVWTAMSAVMLLGMQSTALLLRTMLPSIGLLVLVFIVTACNAQLTTEKLRAPQSPESPGVREANTSRSITTGGSSNYPPTRFEDFKRNEILSVSAFERPREAPRPDGHNTTQRPAETRRQTFNFQQAAALAAGRITISNPILQANGDQNPLNKIPTMSLEDAMKTEQERRADGLRRESALGAQLLAPQLSALAPEEGLMRAVSLKRKTVASVSSEQMFRVRSSPSELMPAAATTSAQLSPGVEEIRRRSPRQSPTVQNTIQNIRPSRQLQERSEPAPSAESAKTPLQRRPTIGLPGNPRAKAVKAPATDDKNQRQQTVLFINKIVYDDPDAVESVMQGTNSKGYDARDSIVHRPRPIPRHLDEDRNIFPAEAASVLAGHRRSKSGGSIGLRTSNLHYTSGGAPQVPPMPPPPLNMAAYKGGQKTNRPLPNDTKSMTFDEKMMLLFPAPLSADSLPRRRSSLPQIPQIPFDFIPISISPMGESSRVSGTTAKTGGTSIRTGNILEVVELPPMDRVPIGGGPRRLSDEVGGSWLSDIDTGDIVTATQRASKQSGSDSRRTTKTTNERRASSPVLPQIRDSALTASTGTQSHDDFTTNWGSVHFSAVAVPIQANRQIARSTYVKGESRDAAGNMLQTRAPSGPGDSPPLTDEEENGDAGPVQAKIEERRTSQQAQWHRRIGDDCPTFSGRKEKAWSRKMVPPTPLMLGAPSTKRPFIVKVAEPSPLESPEHALAQIQAQLKKFEEASMSVSGSPSQRFALLEDLEKEMDAQAGHWRTMQQDLRRDSMSSTQTFSTMAESRRQSIASNGDAMMSGKSIGADRRASRRLRMQSAHLGVPPPITEEKSSPTAIATKMSGANAWQQRLAEAQAEFTGSASRLGGSRRSANFLGMSELGSPTPPDSDDSDAELERYEPASIDQALAAVAEAARKIADVRQLLWTPVVAAQAALTTSAAMLWMPTPRAADDSATLFARSVSLTEQMPRLPSRRRKISGDSDADLPPIETSTLWSDEGAGRAGKQSGAGLWAARPSTAILAATATPALQPGPETKEGTAVFEPELELDIQFIQEQKPPRPVTQRPPRRSRRITMLPDIIENPEPLPNKRDTLGIFQFPWGEKSDMATFPLRTTTLAAMPGTMSSGGGPAISAALEARSRQLESSEYSSSFFDEYDEEDELDKEVQGLDSDSDYSDSDDGFDENTLWEIASLLKTQQVPSKFSLLPPPLPPLEKDLGTDEYMSEIPSYRDEDVVSEEYEALKEAEADIFVGMDRAIMDASREEVRASPLWRSNGPQQAAEAKTMFFGVAQPDEASWKSYDSVSQAATARSKPRLSDPVTIKSSQLWEAPSATQAAMAQTPSLLWASTTVSRQSRSQPVDYAGKLWTATGGKKGMMAASTAGGKAMLFDLEAAAALKMRTQAIRTTDEEPASLNAPRAPRPPRPEALEPLTSSGLWTSPSKPLQLALLWTPMPKPVVKAVKSLLFDLDVATTQKLRSAVIRTTDKEPAALNAPRMPRSLKYASLEKLTSSSLWTAPSKAAAKLWAPTMLKLVVKAKSPLFDLDAATAQKLRSAVVRTTDKEPAALNMPRKPRTVSRLPLGQLVSVSLWQPAGHGRINKALWAPKARVTIRAKGLLFDREASMAEKQNTPVRTTDKEPAALQMPRKVRKLSHAPLETFKSARLWQSRPHNKKMLWAPRPVVAVVATGHLFDLAVSKAEKSRAHTRTTDKEPAALRMPRKARKVDWAPLERLSSSRLWQSSAAAKSLWMPKPVAMEEAQGRRQKHLLFDLAAAVAEKSRYAHTRTTDKEPAALHMPRRARKASRAPLATLVSGSLWQPPRSIAHSNTLWAPKPATVVKTESRLFDLEAARAQKLQLVRTRTMEMEPVAAQAVRVPRSLAHLPMLPLTSTSLWSVEAAVEKSREANWIMAGKPASITSISPASVRKQPLVTPSEGWDAALQEALAVSYPRQERISATADQWQAAMLSAVAQSYPFDSARKHPALAGSAVDSSVILAHDASKTHPVFFTGRVEEAEEVEGRTAQPEPWMAQYDNDIMAQVEALEHEREFAALAAQQQQQEQQEQQISSFTSEPIQEQQAAPEQMSEEDAQYYAYIRAMENDAMLRLQALEGIGAGVQLRY